MFKYNNIFLPKSFLHKVFYYCTRNYYTKMQHKFDTNFWLVIALNSKINKFKKWINAQKVDCTNRLLSRISLVRNKHT